MRVSGGPSFFNNTGAKPVTFMEHTLTWLLGGQRVLNAGWPVIQHFLNKWSDDPAMVPLPKGTIQTGSAANPTYDMNAVSDADYADYQRRLDEYQGKVRMVRAALEAAVQGQSLSSITAFWPMVQGQVGEFLGRFGINPGAPIAQMGQRGAQQLPMYQSQGYAPAYPPSGNGGYVRPSVIRGR